MSVGSPRTRHAECEAIGANRDDDDVDATFAFSGHSVYLGDVSVRPPVNRH